MGKCVSVNKNENNPPPISLSKSQSAKNLPKKGEQINSPAKPSVKSLAQPPSAKKILKAGAKPVTVSSRPLVSNVKGTRSFTRTATLRPSLIGKQCPEATSGTLSKVAPNPQSQKEILLVLKSHFLFNMLSEDIIKQVIKEMKTLLIDSNELIYKQGNLGNVFYLLEKGKLDVLVDNVSSSIILPKQCFGELGLVQDTPRMNTVVTIEKSVLRCIDRLSYKTLLSRVYQKKEDEGVGFLEVIPLFKQLSKGQLMQVAQAAIQVRFGSGEKIIKEGDTGDTFFIVKEGTVNCSKYDQHIRDFHRGEYFGEQGLLFLTKRNATCTASGKVVLLSISRTDLVNVLGQDLEMILSKNTVRIAFSRNQYLKNLSAAQVDMVFGKMELKNFQAKEVILPQNSLRSTCLITVVKGSITTGDSKFRLYDVLGDEELVVENSKRFYRNDLIAEEECSLGIISRVNFEEIIGGNLKNVTQKNSFIAVLKQIPLFKVIPASKLLSIISVMRLEEIPAESVIFHQGDKGDKFYIVKSGAVEILKDSSSIRKIGQNGFFGERSILLDEVRTASAVATEATTCWVLQKSAFLQLIDQKLKETLKRRIELQNDQIELQDLVYISTLNKGIISKIFLVIDQNSSILYFLRTISRNSLSLYNNYDRIITEKNILKISDHPFIGKLIRTYKDDQRIYILQEYINGQDLFEVLTGWERMGNENARFYTAGILIILEYLHTNNIIYRDLKPENIFIDEEGYPKIYDFANSKIVENRTYSTVGTPHYMAPEVIAGKGYGCSADLWALGVILFEFLFNDLPFSPNAGDCYTIYQSILSQSCNFPSGNHVSRPLIEKLLMKNPTMRGTIKAIKDHSFFIGVNWDEYVAKQVPTPRKPKLQNFDKEIASKKNSRNELFPKILVRFM